MRIAVGKDRIGGNDSEFFLALENLLTENVPTRVELAFVLVAPVLVYLVRRVRGTGGVIEKERFVWRGLLLAVNIGDGLIGNLCA